MTNHESRHKTVAVQVGEYHEEIDELLAPLIETIWRLGIHTAMSCQETSPGIAWIEFDSLDDLQRFLNIVARYEPGTDTLYSRIHYDLNPLFAGAWEYQLNFIDLNELDDFSGETFFDFTVGAYFPVTDIPLLLDRLNELIRSQ